MNEIKAERQAALDELKAIKEDHFCPVINTSDVAKKIVALAKDKVEMLSTIEQQRVTLDKINEVANRSYDTTDDTMMMNSLFGIIQEIRHLSET